MKSKTRKDNMKTQLTYAVAILLATIAVATAAPDKDAIMAKEKAAWQAFKDKKADDFKKVVDKGLPRSLRGRHLRSGEGIGRHEKVGHEIVYHQRFQRLL